MYYLDFTLRKVLDLALGIYIYMYLRPVRFLLYCWLQHPLQHSSGHPSKFYPVWPTVLTVTDGTNVVLWYSLVLLLCSCCVTGYRVHLCRNGRQTGAGRQVLTWDITPTPLTPPPPPSPHPHPPPSPHAPLQKVWCSPPLPIPLKACLQHPLPPPSPP